MLVKLWLLCLPLTLVLSENPDENYFNGAFVLKIEHVANLIATILKDEEKFPFTQGRQKFLSQTALTATNIPIEAEGSGQPPEMKAYVPLTDIRRLATNYLDLMARDRFAVEAKTILKET